MIIFCAYMKIGNVGGWTVATNDHFIQVKKWKRGKDGKLRDWNGEIFKNL